MKLLFNFRLPSTGVRWDAIAKRVKRTPLEKPKRRIDYSLNHVLSLNVCEKFQFAIAELKTQLPDVPKFSTIINDFWIRKEFIDWWTINSSAWIAKLRSVMIEYRNIGHDWQFSDTQKKQLQQYYDANKLLVDCLNTDCYVSREVRQEIEETLLLPIAEIQKRQQRG